MRLSDSEIETIHTWCWSEATVRDVGGLTAHFARAIESEVAERCAKLIERRRGLAAAEHGYAIRAAYKEPPK